MSFEENLIDYAEAEIIRREHVLEGLNVYRLAMRHGLPASTIKKILAGKLHAHSETPASKYSRKK